MVLINLLDALGANFCFGKNYLAESEDITFFRESDKGRYGQHQRHNVGDITLLNVTLPSKRLAKRDETNLCVFRHATVTLHFLFSIANALFDQFSPHLQVTKQQQQQTVYYVLIHVITATLAL